MRFHPTLNGKFYYELQPLWDFYTRTPHQKWHRAALQAPHTLNHWCDLEGSVMLEILKKDLNFPNWFHTRIRKEACLPLYYGVGCRFIRLTRASPVGFKCEPQPLPLTEARAVRTYERELKKERRRLAKLEAKERKMSQAKNKYKKR